MQDSGCLIGSSREGTPSECCPAKRFGNPRRLSSSASQRLEAPDPADRARHPRPHLHLLPGRGEPVGVRHLRLCQLRGGLPDSRPQTVCHLGGHEVDIRMCKSQCGKREGTKPAVLKYRCHPMPPRRPATFRSPAAPPRAGSTPKEQKDHEPENTVFQHGQTAAHGIPLAATAVPDFGQSVGDHTAALKGETGLDEVHSLTVRLLQPCCFHPYRKPNFLKGVLS